MGPTNLKPCFFKAFDRAVDSGVTAGMSARAFGRSRGSGAKDHTRSLRPPSNRAAAFAFAMVASIFMRLRTIPSSASSRSASCSVNFATFSIAKPPNAFRNASRLRRITSHDRPDWNASRLTRSNSASSPRTGRPHSVSW